MPAIPDWFEVTLTGYRHPDAIPCAEHVPGSALPLGQFFWDASRGGCCVQQYRLCGNQGRQHFILWAGENDEESGRWFFAPAAYASQKGPDGKRVAKRQAALWLLEAFWRGQHLSEGPPGVDYFAMLENKELEEICGRVWPSG